MRLEEMETPPSDEEEDTNTYTDDDAIEDLCEALDLLQKSLITLGKIKQKKGEIKFAPNTIPDLVTELDEFLTQWNDYGFKADH